MRQRSTCTNDDVVRERACEYREHQYGRHLLKAPLYIHPRATCDTRADLPQQLKGELRGWGVRRQGDESAREPKGKGTTTKPFMYTRSRERGCTSEPVLLETVNFSHRASLHPRPFRRGENFGKSISTRRSNVVAATFRRVSGFTKLSRFSRAATKKSVTYRMLHNLGN